MLKNIVVGISGGVDSAVTALLLKKKGFNVVGVFMKNWDIINEKGICLAEQDYNDAKKVCEKLDIPLFQVNFVKEYWNNVFSTLLEKYQSGSTPNPDIICNKNIKFDHFINLAQTKFHADAVATGHYVRTSFGPYLENFKPHTNVLMLKALDPNKDQTFFLSQVSQRSLRYCMFPLGEYFKSDVKKIAREAGLIEIAEKKESMGICFVGKREFQHFISEYIENKDGDFVDLDNGKVVGRHQGIHHWTIGQRCRISGLTDPYFVFQKNLQTNIITVVKGTNHPALYTDLLMTKNPHWIAGEPPELTNSERIFICDFRFQHRKPLTVCNVFKTLNNHLIIQLSKPLRAITIGQYAVLYSGQLCLGSAEITYPGPSYFALGQDINVLENNIKKKLAHS
ncbi:PREDICTED: mitochondrial tRNA-specific 2-thiouridylase 1 isoform X1 [Polistes dominula]|uniref:tRNA-5-taurinomethyluridine 2-sulfurtransferase n=2 Tax=Polistes dominula TaxID=743375 RepID=A0ABM1IZY1_POLDO|nr:PREDICTED: mitochondrial tRNA-specific 2-thiouridylase 1 isoform X1 [Polistes dominula]